MSYQSAEAAWRTALDTNQTGATMVEWLCSSHKSDTTSPVIRYEVWLHGATEPALEHYRLGPDGNDLPVPAWVPRPPAGWDQFPVSQAEGEHP